uniref:TNFR-Cys domain-containing protein n=1 Tax=Papio anubis TaxID=9555 RepID=A0A8I5P4H1_PAPAN
MGLCGQSAPTASSARAGRSPGARTASGTTPWLPDPKTLKFVFVIVAVLLLVQIDSATISRKDEVPPLPVASKQQRRSLEAECPAGFHRSEHTGACNPCTEGVDYTIVSNNLPSCLLCTVCKSGQTNKSSCTTTRDTVCQCEKGSFQNENSPEMCRKCSTGCPRGMIKVSDCTPWSDINCSASAASSTGKTPAAEDTVPTSLGTPDLYGLIAGVVTVFIILFAAAFVCILRRKKLISSLKGICSGRCWLRVGALDTVCPAPSHSVPTDSNPHPCPWSKCLQPGSIFRLVIAPTPHPVYPPGPWSHCLSRGWGSPHLPAKCRRAGPVPPTFRRSQAGGGRLLNWVTRVRMRSGSGIYSALVRAEHRDFPRVGFYSSSPSHPPSSGCPRIARPYSCSQPQGSLSSVPAPSLPLCPLPVLLGGVLWAPSPCLLSGGSSSSGSTGS